MSGGMRRIGYVFLCAAPCLIFPLGGARPLRIPGMYQSVGVMLFGLIAASVWTLVGGRGAASDRRLAVAGTLLIAPFALIALLWIGLGTPWDATPPENVMRYAVLLAGAIAVTSAFALLKESLADAGEKLYSTLGGTANLLAGAAYVVWLSFELGAHSIRMIKGKVPESIVALGDVYDVLLFSACVVTYLATAGFARAMGKVAWLRQTPAAVFVALNLVALVFLLLRGLSFPDPNSSSTAWYLRPGFIVGIPAMPWLMPYFLGVILLRRAAGDGR